MAQIKHQVLVQIILKILALIKLSETTFGIPNYNSRFLSDRHSGSNSHGSKGARNYLYLNYKESYGIRFDPNKIRKHFKNHSIDVGTNFGDGWTEPGFDNSDPSIDNNGPSVGNGDPNVENGGPGMGDPNMENNNPTGDPNIDNNNDLNMGNKPGDSDPSIGTGDSGNEPMGGMPPLMTTTAASNDVDMVSVSPPVSSNETPTMEASSSTPGDNNPSIVTTANPMMTMMSSDMSATDSAPSTSDKRLVLSFPSLVKRINASKKNNTVHFYRPSSSPLKNTLNLIKKRIKQWLSWGSDFNASLVNGQRFLNVFNVIKFENGPCTSMQAGLNEMSGVCYQDYQCSELGGVPIDSCADGLGVCCIFKADCGQTTNEMTTFFQNPGWPAASQDRLICTLTVNLQSNVAQVLLDFISLELKAPVEGNCAEDQFLVAGQNLNNQIPTICGINSGQHMYVEVDNAVERKLFLSILTTGSAARAFNIRVTQLTSPVAPNNCLQYYTDLEGWFQTFNYDDTSQFVAVRNPSYFNNLNYVICIKRQWDYCSITYSNEAENVEYDFQLVNVDSEGMSLIPEKQAGLEIFNCNDDYISVNSIRLCGEKLNDASRSDDLNLNAIVTDTTSGLNIIPVHTNDMIVGRGFRINYKQIPCVPQPQPYDSVEESAETEMLTDNGPILNQSKRRFNSKLTID